MTEKVAAAKLFEIIRLNDNVKMATKVFSEKLILRATRRTYRYGRSTDNLEVMITFGRPNFLERGFIKKYKETGEPFPIKKIQVKRINKLIPLKLKNK